MCIEERENHPIGIIPVNGNYQTITINHRTYIQHLVRTSWPIIYHILDGIFT